MGNHSADARFDAIPMPESRRCRAGLLNLEWPAIVQRSCPERNKYVFSTLLTIEQIRFEETFEVICFEVPSA
jgi:hypothetical protein